MKKVLAKSSIRRINNNHVSPLNPVHSGNKSKSAFLLYSSFRFIFLWIIPAIIIGEFVNDSSLFISETKILKRSELKFVSRTIPQNGGNNTPQLVAEFRSGAYPGVHTLDSKLIN